MRHFHKDLDKLKLKLMALSSHVEQNVRLSVQALEKRDGQIAENVIQTDKEIDVLEVEVEEECLKILALHQPVAIDLRFIVAVLKINNDLERIGDLAVNIAQRALLLTGETPLDLPFDFPGMAAKAQKMLRESLDSLVNLDPSLARRVCESDDEVDAATADLAALVKNEIRQDPRSLTQLIHYLLISRHIERIADLATNIAEDTIYMVEGEIVRHRGGIEDS